MRKLLGLVGAVALAGAGCASSMHEQREAQLHQQRAQAAAARGDYNRAAIEQNKSTRESREAQKRAFEEQQNQNGMPYNQPMTTPPVSNPTMPPPGVPY